MSKTQIFLLIIALSAVLLEGAYLQDGVDGFSIMLLIIGVTISFFLTVYLVCKNDPQPFCIQEKVILKPLRKRRKKRGTK